MKPHIRMDVFGGWVASRGALHAVGPTPALAYYRLMAHQHQVQRLVSGTRDPSKPPVWRGRP